MGRHASHRAPGAPSGRELVVRVLRGVVLICVALWFATLVRVPSAPDPPGEPGPTLAEQHLADMLQEGACWNGLGNRPFPQHAFYRTPTTALHYGPSGPALAIVYGPDGLRYSGDEAPGTVYAFCR